MVTLIFLGDVVGRSGREAVLKALPELKTTYKPDAIIVNIENAARGFGITPKIAQEFLDARIDVLTSGNHTWDKKEVIPFIAKEPRLLRPANYPQSAPGQGSVLVESAQMKKILTINLMGQLMMPSTALCPFALADEILKRYTLGQNVDAIFVDFHAETTSEKQAMGRYLDGRVSAVVGSHTHVPTADERILPKGTAYQTDAGMCGDYNSVIGMEPGLCVQRFVRKFSDRLEPAEGPGTACGLIVSVGDNGLARSVQRVALGHKL